MQDLLCSLQACESFCDLSSDGNDLNDRCHEKAQEERVSEEASDGQSASHNLVRAHIHDYGAHYSHQQASRQAHDRCRSERAHHILQQAAHASGKDRFLARFGVISLNHADATQRLRQAAGYFRIDFAALAENGPNGAECLIERECEAEQKTECQHGHDPADAE